MVRKLTLVGLTIFAAAGASHALGAVADHPYSGIVERNPFGLRPIPPPQAEVKPEVAPPPPSREIKLTGISTLLGPAKVFIEIVDLQTKKTERPSGMTVGEQQFEVEILSVNPEDGVVRIRNRGEESTLDFINNGIKPAAGMPAGNPALPAPPAFAGFRPPAPPPIGANPPPVSAPGASSASRAIVAGGPSSSSPAATAATGVPPEAEARIEAYKRMLQARQQNGGSQFPGITPPPAPGH